MTRHISMLLVGMLLVVVTGCGSGGYASDAKSAIDNMNKVIKTYNSAAPGDVASTGESCSNALNELSGKAMPSPQSAPRAQRVVARALRQAYLEAKRGFGDCAAAGPRDDYALMARAAQEIYAANSSLQKAKALDH